MTSCTNNFSQSNFIAHYLPRREARWWSPASSAESDVFGGRRQTGNDVSRKWNKKKREENWMMWSELPLFRSVAVNGLRQRWSHDDYDDDDNENCSRKLSSLLLLSERWRATGWPSDRKPASKEGGVKGQSRDTSYDRTLTKKVANISSVVMVGVVEGNTEQSNRKIMKWNRFKLN